MQPDREKPQSDYHLDQPIPGLGAVVLCGGKSKRMGVDKSQLVFNGKTFLENVIEQVSAVTDLIVLVGDIDFGAHQLPSNILITEDERPNCGPLEGIRVGLKQLSKSVDHALVTSCDVPLLKPELIRYLFDRVGKFQAIVPVGDRQLLAMTAIYRTEAHAIIDQRVAAGQLRVSDLADAIETFKIPVESLKEVDPDGDLMTNINSADDYLALLERFSQQCPSDLLARLNR